MADKLGVSIDCVIKTIFDKKLDPELRKFMGAKLKAAINKSSKLEVVDGTPDKGFSLTSTLELTKDDKSKPVQLKATIAIAILASGLTAGTINLKTPGEADAGNPDKFAARAKDVIDAILDNMVPKVVKAMESKVP
jgi:hypothetical protein